MATIFKTLSTEDIVSSRTLLYEQIPITGTIVSGTYSSSAGGEQNILNYSHGMFQTVFDYPYLSSSANNLFDVTVGAGVGSLVHRNIATASFGTKKLNIYNQMAKVLYGYDLTGAINQFDKDGSSETSNDKTLNGFFMSFSRLLVKDEIKKGSFRLTLGLGGHASGSNLTGTISDVSGAFATPSYKTNSPAGEYGILFLSESAAGSRASYNSSQLNPAVGLIFYQAGIIFLNSDLFAAYSSVNNPTSSLSSNTNGQLTTATSFTSSDNITYTNVQSLLLTGSIRQCSEALRRRMLNVQFQNTTELNSTIYFLRINNNEFNYSANPTYLSASEIRVKGGNPLNAPVSYITTAGLYSADNELLAVAKLSQPLKKTEEQSMILRVRLDY